MRQDKETHLSHCLKCGVVHLSHEEKAGIIECPVCVLARAGRYGQRRARTDRLDVPAERLFGAWAGGAAWPAASAAEHPSRV
jgi:hypothetical protein